MDVACNKKKYGRRPVRNAMLIPYFDIYLYSITDASKRRRDSLLREGGQFRRGPRVRRRRRRLPAPVRQRAQRLLRHHDVPRASCGRLACRAHTQRRAHTVRDFIE